MEDRTFYLVTAVLLLMTMISLFAGFLAASNILTMISYILSILLTLFLIAVAQSEWEERGGRWR